MNSSSNWTITLYVNNRPALSLILLLLFNPQQGMFLLMERKRGKEGEREAEREGGRDGGRKGGERERKM